MSIENTAPPCEKARPVYTPEDLIWCCADTGKPCKEDCDAQ